MTNILTIPEAANTLRTADNDINMVELLPQVDAYIAYATGRNWAADAIIRPEAKSAARMLLVKWHEDPGMIGQSTGSLDNGLTACLVQLEVIAMQLETDGIPDDDLALARSLPVDGATGIAITASLVLMFNHEMDTSATTAVTLKSTSGSAVVVVNTLGVTRKIMTVNPAGSLAASTAYILTITTAADVYGQTITDELRFTTA